MSFATSYDRLLTKPQSNGKTGEELSRQPKNLDVKRPQIRTQRTKLQSALLAHVPPGVIELSKKLVHMVDKGEGGVELQFKDGTVVVADLVVGADGIRSVSTVSAPHCRAVAIHPDTSYLGRLYETRPGQTTRSSSREPPSGVLSYPGTMS